MQVMIAPVIIYNGPTNIGIIIFYQVDLTIRQIVLFGKEPKRMQVVGISYGILFIVIKQIRHGCKCLAALIGPARAVPLTSPLTFKINKLFKIIFIRRLIGSKTKIS